MVIVGTLVWWYTRGFHTELLRVQSNLASLYDYFSIDLLLKTLFTPFRQISAGNVRGPIAVQVRAFFDKTFSRMIGAAVRGFMIVFGTIALAASAVLSIVRIVGWLILPVLPIVGCIVAASGWVPWQV